MAGLGGISEWRWYLRDHVRWWKWPLIVTTLGLWLAVVVVVMPWQSNASPDRIATGPVTTEPDADAEPIETFEPTTTSGAIDTRDVGADVEIPTTSIEVEAEAEVVQSLPPAPPTSVEVTEATEATELTEVTEPTETSRRRPNRTVEPAPAPAPPPILNPFGEGIFTAAPPTPTRTVRPPATTTTTARPTTTTTTARPTTTTTTVRPTTTIAPEPPPPPTTVRPTTTIATEPPPPTTVRPTTTIAPEPPPPPASEPPPATEPPPSDDALVIVD